MREPLRHLFSNTSVSSSSHLLANRPIGRPIHLIISDLFVLPPIWEGYKNNIMSYLFVPNSLMTFMRYINTSMDKVKSDEVGFNFDRQMHATIPLAKGLICNSFLELDGHVLHELHRQSVPGSRMPILFVAPLMSEDFGQKRHVRISKCLVSYNFV